MSVKQERVVEIQGFRAEYSTGQRRGGDWFALGTVRSQARNLERGQGTWMIVGAGVSAEDAVQEMTEQLRRQVASRARS